MTSAQGVKYFVAGDSAVPSWWSLCGSVFRLPRPVLYQPFIRLIEVGWISAAGPTVQENFFMLRCHHLDTDKPIVLRFSPGMERCTAGLGTDVRHQTDLGELHAVCAKPSSGG